MWRVRTYLLSQCAGLTNLPHPAEIHENEMHMSIVKRSTRKHIIKAPPLGEFGNNYLAGEIYDSFILTQVLLVVRCYI